MRWFLPSVLGVMTLLGGSLRAQPCSILCVSFQTYGAGCNTVFGTTPTLTGVLDPQSCSVTLTLSGFPGCCNTFLTGRLLAIGASPANLAIPAIGPSCTLLVSADILLELQASSGNTFTFFLPPGMPPGTYYFQGANVYFTTIGFSLDAELSNGLAVTVS